MFRRFRGQGPWLLLSAIALAVIVSPLAVAQSGGSLLGGKRNPGANTSSAYTSETQIIANNNTYGTRQSNKSSKGGGAIYGCRSAQGGSEQGNRPCIRSNNLNTGRAFEFESRGPEVGRIVARDANAAPFTTNATGVATGLNADRVDGKHASDIVADVQAKMLFAQVAANGTLGAHRGATASARTAQGAYQVAFPGDISACAVTATPAQVANVGPIGAALADDKKTVTVHTYDQAGAAADRPFHLTVIC
jgi:hypothetical protein